jgi:hypothetical protein
MYINLIGKKTCKFWTLKRRILQLIINYSTIILYLDLKYMFFGCQYWMGHMFHFHVFYVYSPRKYISQYFIIYILYVSIAFIHKIRENEKYIFQFHGYFFIIIFSYQAKILL